MTDTTRTLTTTANARQPHSSTNAKQATATACCGGPAPGGTDACCARDAEVKSTGGAGCGCSSVPAGPAPKKTGCC